jgi:hypothetical protein
MRRWEALFDVVELDRTSDGVGRAATQMALIENRRAVGTMSTCLGRDVSVLGGAANR